MRTDQRQADPLRLRQRRLRRPRHRARRPRTTAPLIPVSTYGASKLAGEALIASYAYMFGLSRLRASASATSSARARPTASASTSCAGCSARPAAGETRSPCASWATAASPSRTSTSSDVVRAVLTAHDRTTAPFARLQRRDRRLHHVARDRRAGGRVRGAARRARRASPTPAATAAGRATSRSCGSTRRASARSAGAASAPSREALRRVDAGHDPRHASGADVSAPAPRPRRSARQSRIPKSSSCCPANDVAEPGAVDRHPGAERAADHRRLRRLVPRGDEEGGRASARS